MGRAANAGRWPEEARRLFFEIVDEFPSQAAFCREMETIGRKVTPTQISDWKRSPEPPGADVLLAAQTISPSRRGAASPLQRLLQEQHDQVCQVEARLEALTQEVATLRARFGPEPISA